MSDFDRGVKAGNEHELITIAINGVWGGRIKGGGHTSSYEKIGYHAGSVEFLDGVLSTGVPVKRAVEVDGKIGHEMLTSNPWKESA